MIFLINGSPLVVVRKSGTLRVVLCTSKCFQCTDFSAEKGLLYAGLW